MNRSVSCLGVGSIVLVPALALAQEPATGGGADKEEQFGKAGVLNIASDLSLSVEHTIFSAPSGPSPGSTTAYSIGPAADYFVIHNLSVGLGLQFAKSSIAGSEGTETTFRVAPRVGYHIPFVPGRLGLWPRAECGYETATLKAEGLAGDITEKRVVLGLFIPLLIHPVEHFHIGIGPFIDTDLSSTEAGNDAVKETTIGFRTEIAGWWNLLEP